MNSGNNVKGDNRPTDYEYACLSKHVYSVADSTLEVGTKLQTPFQSWTISFVSAPTYCGYFGAVYECPEIKSYVIVHRGTNNFVDYIEDYIGVFRNQCSFQKSEAFRLVDLVVQKLKNDHSREWSLSFTGHSLGAFLAELSVYYATVVLNFPNVHAVTFESPGSLQSMKSICWNHLPNTDSNPSSPESGGNSSETRNNNPFNFPLAMASSSSWPSLQLIPHNHSDTSLQSYFSHKNFNSIVQKLDIISYVCYPNIVNICNTHAGTLYAINIWMEDYKRIWPQRLFTSHSIVGIVEWFQRSTKGDPRCVRLFMADWPKNYAASQVFFKHAKFEDGMLSVENLLDITQSEFQPPKRQVRIGRSSSKLSLTSVMESSIQFDKWIKRQKKKFVLKFHGNFDVVHDSTSALPLHHFSIPMQDFLKYFHKKRNYIFNKYTNDHEVELRHFFKESWSGFTMPEEVREELLSFKLQRNKLFIKELVCEKCNIHDFRQLLSNWLEKTGFIVDELINVDLVDELMWGLKELSAHNSN